MKDTTCFFCKVNADPQHPNVILQNQQFIALFDSYPVNPGHCLITPRHHVQYLKDLSLEEWQQLHATILEIINNLTLDRIKSFYEDAISNPISPKSQEYCQQALVQLNAQHQATAYNYGINDGPDAGQTVPHFHLHIIPRYKNDISDPIGGIRNTIPGKANYKK